ncbi:MAG TPA: ABC transporter permease [Candidatus Eisenbacteria bacterium]|nr:ABC transporter permease [Candidatus Eisenbacteria bacterium]
MTLPFNVSRTLAVAERDLRRFRRNIQLVIPMVMMPIIYLLILGKSMGGDLHHIPVAIVVEDEGAAAAAVRKQMMTLQAARQLFLVREESDVRAAVDRLRQGDYRAVVIVPPNFSEDFARGEKAELGLALDNTDGTSSNTIEGEMRRAIADLRVEGRAPPMARVGVTVERVDVYGHKNYMQYLVPGVIALALFFVAMVAGGIILVDDRARGIHEGYFVTPLTSLDLVMGLTLSATTLALCMGTLVTVSSIAIAQLPLIGGLPTLLMVEFTIFLLGLGLVLFMFTLMARVSNPMTPRALFGILNVITFFPSGALYPTESYPGWLQALSRVNPMRYAVHALRNLLLKGVGFQAVLPDFLILIAFAGVMLVLASTLFKRTL